MVCPKIDLGEIGSQIAVPNGSTVRTGFIEMRHSFALGAGLSRITILMASGGWFRSKGIRISQNNPLEGSRTLQWCMGIYHVIYAHSKHKILEISQNVIYAHASSLSDGNHRLYSFCQSEMCFYKLVFLPSDFLNSFWHSGMIYMQFEKHFCLSTPT